jgi:hypothetical protein
MGISDPSKWSEYSGLEGWVARVYYGLDKTYTEFPFMAYGTDWLAFGHLVIALFFLKPWIEPGKHNWVLKCGIIACVGVIPLAIICGEIRGIPFYWRMIDCSFGVFGLIPLLYCLGLTRGIFR